MKKITMLSIFLLFICCQKTDWNKVTVLEITGEAKTEIIPEYFNLYPQIVVFSNNNRAAYDSVKKISDALIIAMKNLDNAAIINLKEIDVALTDRWGRKDETKADYRASVGIQITSKRIDLISKIINTFVKINVTEIGLPTLKSSKIDSLSNLLRKKAYEDAMQKAIKSANSYGATLGKVLSVKSSETYPATMEDIYKKIFGEAEKKQIVGGLLGGLGSAGLDDLIEGRKLNIYEEIDVYFELKWK
jgi:uncharacterized protein YggE